MARIFINYRTDDEPFAAILLDQRLVQEFGADSVFRDTRSIQLGADFVTELWGSLADAELLLVVIGARWLTLEIDGVRRLDQPDDYVRREIEHALANDILVVPVLLDDAHFPDADELPPTIRALATRQYLRIHKRDAHRYLNVLIKELAVLLGARPAAEAPTVAVNSDDAFVIVAARIHHESLAAYLRDAAYDAVRVAAVTAGIAWEHVVVSDRVDGIVLLLPAVAGTRVAGPWIDALRSELAIREGLRLRVALHTGAVTHDVTVAAAELADAPVLRDVMARDLRSALAILVTDEFHRTVLRRDAGSIGIAGYAPSRVGDRRVWIYVPGRPTPPGLSSTPSHSTPAPSTVVNQSGGNIFNGTTIISGDVIGGNKYGGL